MNNINPRTGKRLGKFLWMDATSEREALLRSLKEKVNNGYYASDLVVSSIIDDLAPVMCDNMGIDVVT